jgi:regulator of sigma E protease
MSILLVLAAILLLGILIVVHELGHFWAARWTGIAVHQFSVGFGPKLIKWKSKKYDTEFMIRAIPLGGYCLFVGEDDAEGKHDEDPRAYNKQKVWKRMLSVLMGPGMNFILALTALWPLLFLHNQAPDNVAF